MTDANHTGEQRWHRVSDARAGERVLLERVRDRARRVRGDPRAMAQRMLVVVPSGSLRTHLVAALVRGAGGALLGVEVRTATALALEVVAPHGVGLAHRGEALLDLLASRAALRQPSLRRALADLEEGGAAVVGAVRDLVDAGLTPELEEPLLEALHPGAGATPAELERARALVRAALDAEVERQGVGRGGRALVLREAAETLRAGGNLRSIEGAELWLSGFADATGLMADFLEALLDRTGGHVLWCEPIEPHIPWNPRAPRASGFSDRLKERLEVRSEAPPGSNAKTQSAEPPQITPRTVRGLEQEARAALDWVQEQVRSGAAMERTAIVARDLSPYAAALRLHGARLGLPISGRRATGPLSPTGRALSALLDILRERDKTPLVRLFAAIGTPGTAPDGWPNDPDGLLALHTLGVARLGALASGAVTESRELFEEVLLPVRSKGMAIATDSDDREEAEDSSEPDSDPEEEPTKGHTPGSDARLRRRRVPLSRLAPMEAQAKAALEQLSAWERLGEVSAHTHAAQLKSLLQSVLGWTETDAEEAAAPSAADIAVRTAQALAEDLGDVTPLSLAEWQRCFERQLRGELCVPLGGRGGGVQVLTVMEARGLAFDALVVMGLVRDQFPRRPSEDPLLPDAVRQRIGVLLPELSTARRAHEEERHLFAELCAAAPKVLLLSPKVDDDGVELGPSPFFARLKSASGLGAEASLPPARPRTPFEAARALALAIGRREDEASRARLLESASAALSEAEFSAPSQGLASASQASAAAPVPDAALWQAQLESARRHWRARFAAIDLLDRPSGDGKGPGPFDGWIGPTSGEDPRSGKLYVTTLERIARCGWKTLLEHFLGLEPPPDPLAALPALDRRLVGNVVHRVLERWTKAALRQSPTRPADVPWPSPQALEATLLEAAQTEALKEGVRLPGLVRALVERARPFLERAHAMEWTEGSVAGVWAVETDERLDLAPFGLEAKELHFRADRSDRDRTGAIRHVDYKTGPSPVRQKSQRARRNALVRAIAEGKLLQGFVYSAAGGTPGRYAYLHPDEALGFSDLEVDATALDHGEAFRLSARTAFSALEEGAFAPRLADTSPSHSEPSACAYCEVSLACLRGDSGARARLVDTAERGLVQPPRNPDKQRGARAWLDLWYLPLRAKLLSKGEGEAEEG